MITFNIAGFLTDFTEGRSQLKLNSSPATVGAALGELWEKHVGLRDRVVNEKGEVRLHVNVFVNNETIRRQDVLETTLADGSELIGTAYLKNIQQAKAGNGYKVSYRQDALTKLGKSDHGKVVRTATRSSP